MDFEPEQHDFVITKVKKLHREAFSVYGGCGSKPDSEPTWYASGTRTEGVSESKEPSDENLIADLWILDNLEFPNGTPYLGYVRYYHQGFRVSQLERHRFESQTWIALEYKSILVVAPDEGDSAPNIGSVEAFLIVPGDVIAIRRGVWMCHFFPISDEASFNVITERREPEQDRDLLDFRKLENSVIELDLSSII